MFGNEQWKVSKRTTYCISSIAYGKSEGPCLQSNSAGYGHFFVVSQGWIIVVVWQPFTVTKTPIKCTMCKETLQTTKYMYIFCCILRLTNRLLVRLSIHRPESCDISGNFKRTPSTKYETMISKPRPKQRKNSQNCSEWFTFYTFSP